jgi:hypothetical protein
MPADDPPVSKPKGGRPRVAEQGVPIGTWLKPADYDQIAKAAKAQEMTISALVRSWLRLKLK